MAVLGHLSEELRQNKQGHLPGLLVSTKGLQCPKAPEEGDRM